MSPRSRVALATSTAWPELSADDRLLLPYLEQAGIEAAPAIWSDPACRWEEFDGVLVRSCWDYHCRLEEFEAWLARLENLGMPTWNPLAVLRWNLRKTYLLELEEAGVPIVPTEVVEPAGLQDLDDVLAARNWGEAVLKPVVGASGQEVRRLRRGDVLGAASPPVWTGAWLLQEFQEQIVAAGEWSLMFIDGRFSHAVLKTARAGEFRVQTDHGGSVARQPPPTDLVVCAEAVLAARDWDLLYARVDLVSTVNGPRLVELELIEPALFLGEGPEAADRLAIAIGTRLSRP